MAKQTYLSLIVPFYNEKENLAQLHQEIISVLSKQRFNSEVIYVNDGSTDKSSDQIKSKNGKTKINIKIVTLRKNFGQTAAIMAGVSQAKGELVGFLDSDLQNDPNDIPKLLAKIDAGAEAVVGWRKNRQDEFFHTISSRMINQIVRGIFKVPLHDTGCSLKIIRSDVLKDVKLYGEYHRLVAILLFWRGIRIEEVVINHRPRVHGASKYGYLKIFKFVVDLITIKFLHSYGTKPAYIFGILGIFCCLSSTLPLALTVYEKVTNGIFVHRNPLFLISIFLFLLGVQFILMGLLAELLVRIYFESQDKPTYEIKKIDRISDTTT